MPPAGGRFLQKVKTATREKEIGLYKSYKPISKSGFVGFHKSGSYAICPLRAKKQEMTYCLYIGKGTSQFDLAYNIHWARISSA